MSRDLWYFVFISRGKKAFLIYSLLFLFSMRKTPKNHMRVCAYNANFFFHFTQFLLCTHVHKRTRTPKKWERKRENPDRQIDTRTDRLRFIRLNYLIQNIWMTNHKSFYIPCLRFISFFFGLLDIYRIFSSLLALFVHAHNSSNAMDFISELFVRFQQ